MTEHEDIQKSKIYTRKGDNGQTTLFNMEHVSKSNPCFECLGDIDEANAYIGIIDDIKISVSNKKISIIDIQNQLIDIQSRLLDCGSHIATPLTSSSSTKISLTAFDHYHVEQLELWIDTLDSCLPPLKNFILPQSPFHIVRTIIRRAERHLIPLIDSGDCDQTVLKYLNRLSDYFFVLARYTSKSETIYSKTRPNPIHK